MAVELDISKLNLQDALDMAVLIEKEAEERYLWIADKIGQNYPGDAADFFTWMAGNEKKHGMELAARRRALFADAPSRVTADMIEDVEAPDMGKPRAHMSPRHALDVAMESEVKAYEFFDQALPGVTDPDVRKLFEELRAEELEHQELLNQQKAKYPDTREPDLGADDIDTPAL